MPVVAPSEVEPSSVPELNIGRHEMNIICPTADLLHKGFSATTHPSPPRVEHRPRW